MAVSDTTVTLYSVLLWRSTVLVVVIHFHSTGCNEFTVAVAKFVQFILRRSGRNRDRKNEGFKAFHVLPGGISGYACHGRRRICFDSNSNATFAG